MSIWEKLTLVKKKTPRVDADRGETRNGVIFTGLRARLYTRDDIKAARKRRRRRIFSCVEKLMGITKKKAFDLESALTVKTGLMTVLDPDSLFSSTLLSPNLDSIHQPRHPAHPGWA
jgi:hypothetical protein